MNIHNRRIIIEFPLPSESSINDRRYSKRIFYYTRINRWNKSHINRTICGKIQDSNCSDFMGPNAYNAAILKKIFGGRA